MQHLGHGAGRSLIVGGHRAAPYELPFVVHVQSSRGSCTGTLLGHSWALTAAHCVEDLDAGSVLVRTHELPAESDGGTSCAQGLDVSRIIIHHGYTATEKLFKPLHRFDAALLRLAAPADLLCGRILACSFL